ncbi:TAXI family TRAP transporter solute-binding subunit, partial [Marinospirillum sp.]|uniref:TAXI family TRAP transporter solute-binding subunit n=1 Tax=Marinospirillum sp. TaxID=2183934 RepID=UPI003A84702A
MLNKLTLSQFLAKPLTFAAAAVTAAALATAPISAEARTERLAFSGGPDGGTFQYFSNGIATRLSRELANVEVSNMASAGSVENLRRVNSRDADFGIVYSGDLYLGLNGQLTNDTRRYRNVQAVAYMFGAPAHLIVLDNSGIQNPQDLVGR